MKTKSEYKAALAALQAEASAAFESGKYADVIALNPKIDALKALEGFMVDDPAPAPTQRLDLSGAANDAPAQVSAQDWAVKSFFTKQFGSVPEAATEMARELYASVRDGEDYAKLYWAKSADYRRFLKTGMADPSLARLILLTPDQILNAAFYGASIKEMKTTMIEGQDTLGGYLVPEDIRLNMIGRLPGLTVVRSRAQVDPTSSDTVVFATSTGGSSIYPGAVRVTWVDEQPTGTEAATNMTFGQVKIPVHTVMAHAAVSKNLLEDNAYDLAGRLNRDIAGAYAIDEDAQFLTGNGVGRPQGILLDTTTGGPADSNVTTVNSGAAAALTADGIVAVPFGLGAQYRVNNACWAMAKATVLAIRQLKDGQGRYLWDDNQRLMLSMKQPTLLSYEIAESEQMPTIAANQYPIIFGDFKGYQIVDRVGMSVLRYDDSTTAKSNQVVLVARRRLGGQTLEGWRFVVQKVSA